MRQRTVRQLRHRRPTAGTVQLHHRWPTTPLRKKDWRRGTSSFRALERVAPGAHQASPSYLCTEPPNGRPTSLRPRRQSASLLGVTSIY